MNKKWLIATPLIAILLVIGGLMIWIGTVTAQELRKVDFSLRLFEMDVISAQETSNETFTVNPSSRLVLENAYGDITVSGIEGDEMKVEVQKTAWGRTEGDAQNELLKLKVDFTQNKDEVNVHVDLPHETVVIGTSRSPSVNFNIQVPYGMKLVLVGRAGDLVVEDVVSSVSADVKFGNIYMDGIEEGPLTVSSSNGNITLKNIRTAQNNLEIISQFGDVNLQVAEAAALKIEAQAASIWLGEINVSGTVELHSDFGDIDFNQGSIGQLKTETKNGSITLSGLEIREDVNAASDFGDVQLSNVDAEAYAMQSRNGAIQAQGLSGSVEARSDYGDLRLSGADEASLTLETANGAISFEGSLGPGPHNINTDFGDVHLLLPGNSQFNLDAQTNFGDIESDFEVTTTTSQMENKHWVGKVNGGGSPLTIYTKNGNIHLETN